MTLVFGEGEQTPAVDAYHHDMADHATGRSKFTTVAILIALVIGAGLGYGIGHVRSEATAPRSTAGSTRVALDNRETKLNEMADTLDKRQAAIEVEEKRIAENSVKGDAGSLIVGTDVKQGTYRAVDATEGCQWVTYSTVAAEDGDLIDVGHGPGQVIFTLTDRTKLVRISDCPDFRRIEVP